MIRLGLCCKFFQEPIHFRTTTVTALGRLTRPAALEKIDEICRHNAAALQRALEFCETKGIGAFRVNSQILPVKTHPEAGYDIRDLPSGKEIMAAFKACGRFAADHNIRLSFHPDQFVVLNSPNAEVVARSVEELRYQAQVAEWIGADVINIHAGGVYGDKDAALKRLLKTVKRLPANIKSRLTLENDDRSYTPRDLIPVSPKIGLPLVYDVHHHRCLPDGLSIAEATQAALATWQDREPLFHLSSPKDGWQGGKTFRHHDFINIRDFPAEWRNLNVTIEVEAKAKEAAVLKLKKQLARKQWD